jgi:hypothetical protein
MSKTRQVPLPLQALAAPEPDLSYLPRWVTRRQAAQLHARWFGPLTPRTLEYARLPYRRLPGHPAVIETKAFLEWARRRFESAPLLAGGRRGSASAPDIR